MLDRFLSLRHHPIISSNNENHDICRRGSPRSHSCKRCVPRRINKANFSMIGAYTVRPNVLGDSSSLSTCHLSVSYVVKQGCFAVIDMPHHGHYRCSWFWFCVVYEGLFQLCFYAVSVNQFDLMTKLLNHQCSCFLIDGSIHIRHYPEPHQRLHYLGRLHGHFLGQLLHGNGLCQFDFPHDLLRWRLKFVGLVRLWYC